MHVFLLDLPRLEFAAADPEGRLRDDCVLGEEIDNALVDAFLATPQVRACMPPEWQASDARLPVHAAHQRAKGSPKPCADRVLFIGDCGVTRLYKDGIGAAYRTAKAAARAVLFDGISEEALRRRFVPACDAITRDNLVGKLAFLVTRIARKFRPLRKGMVLMVAAEQTRDREVRRMSGVLWDMFSGSAPYLDIFVRMLRPAFLARFAWAVVSSAWRGSGVARTAGVP